MKAPRFFCDNCGAEVDRDTKKCPRCGRFFASVRCPRCGYTGPEEDFAAGCPACGYSSIAGGGPGYRGGRREPEGSRKYEAAGGLPFWVYILTAALAAFVFGLLFNFLR
jgi:ssDNA-binding Zn-finger/Zn-ribbon topoisomerase 1